MDEENLPPSHKETFEHKPAIRASQKKFLWLFLGSLLLLSIGAIAGYQYALTTQMSVGRAKRADKETRATEKNKEKKNKNDRKNKKEAKKMVRLTEPTPVPRTLCTTYTNTQYQFRLTCPTGWYIEDYTNDKEKGALVKIYPPNAEKVEKDLFVMPQFIISLKNTPFNSSPTGNRDVKGDQRVVKNWKQLTVNGVTGYYYDQKSCSVACPSSFDLPYNDGEKTLTIQRIQSGIDKITAAQKKTGIAIQDATDARYLALIISFRFIK